MYYGCTTLDHVVERVGSVTVRNIFDDGHESEYTMSADDAAKRMAGIVFRKYVGGERIRVRFTYDYSIGGRLLEYVNYGFGMVERWTWHHSQD